MKHPQIQLLLIDKRVINHPTTETVRQNLTGVETHIIEIADIGTYENEIKLHQGKRILFLTQNDGDAVKPCPATASPYLCCQYTVISQIHQCPFDCTYCILQNYLESGLMTVFVNLDDIFKQIDQHLLAQPHRFFRFGTGEFGDSLALESIIQTGPSIVDFFRRKSNCLIELKTKSIEIDHLLTLKPRNAVLAWSVNPQSVIGQEELRAASLMDRLQAARKAMEAGYLLAFHFDPLIHFPGWEEAYHDVIESIFKVVDSKRVTWISIGSLRYPPNLKRIIQKRFPKSKIVYEEMISGNDGKMRYFRPIRLEMYQKIVDWIQTKDPELFVYFCMESPDIWEAVMGDAPESNADLDYWFARSLYQRFPELNSSLPNKAVYPIVV